MNAVFCCCTDFFPLYITSLFRVVRFLVRSLPHSTLRRRIQKWTQNIEFKNRNEPFDVWVCTGNPKKKLLLFFCAFFQKISVCCNFLFGYEGEMQWLQLNVKLWLGMICFNPKHCRWYKIPFLFEKLFRYKTKPFYQFRFFFFHSTDSKKKELFCMRKKFKEKTIHDISLVLINSKIANDYPLYFV